MHKFVFGTFFGIFSRPRVPVRVPKIFKNRSRSGLKVRFCFSLVLKSIYERFCRQNGFIIVLKVDRQICGQGSDVENEGSVKNATPTTFWTDSSISESYFEGKEIRKKTFGRMSESVFVFLFPWG